LASKIRYRIDFCIRPSRDRSQWTSANFLAHSCAAARASHPLPSPHREMKTREPRNEKDQLSQETLMPGSGGVNLYNGRMTAERSHFTLSSIRALRPTSFLQPSLARVPVPPAILRGTVQAVQWRDQQELLSVVSCTAALGKMAWESRTGPRSPTTMLSRRPRETRQSAHPFCWPATPVPASQRTPVPWGHPS